MTRSDSIRRGRLLSWLTVGWNVAEGIIAIVAGAVAGSTALLGFGVDSAIEASSGSVMLWRLTDGEAGARRERTALRLVGLSLALLAAWVAWDATAALVRREEPDASPVGIVLAIVSLIVMPLLARAKRKVAGRIESAALVADSKQTELCAWLSAILLAGLLLNAFAGIWWADPVAGLLMVPIIGREGWLAWRGETCCDACP